MDDLGLRYRGLSPKGGQCPHNGAILWCPHMTHVHVHTHTHTHTWNLKSELCCPARFEEAAWQSCSSEPRCKCNAPNKTLNTAASRIRLQQLKPPLSTQQSLLQTAVNLPLRRSCGARCVGRWWQFSPERTKWREVAAGGGGGWWSCRAETSRVIPSVVAAWWSFKSHAAWLNLESPLKKWKLAGRAFPSSANHSEQEERGSTRSRMRRDASTGCKGRRREGRGNPGWF